MSEPRGYFWQNLDGEIAEEFAALSSVSTLGDVFLARAAWEDRRVLSEERAAAAERIGEDWSARLVENAKIRAGEISSIARKAKMTPTQIALAEARQQRIARRHVMRERMPDLRPGITHHFTIIARCNKLKCIAGSVGDHPCTRCGGSGIREIDGYLTCNTYADGRLGEIFIKIGKVGDEQAIYEQWAIGASTAIQYGVPVEAYFRKFLATQFEPSGPTKNTTIKRCTSVLDYVARYVLIHYCNVTFPVAQQEVQP